MVYGMLPASISDMRFLDYHQPLKDDEYISIAERANLPCLSGTTVAFHDGWFCICGGFQLDRMVGPT